MLLGWVHVEDESQSLSINQANIYPLGMVQLWVFIFVIRRSPKSAPAQELHSRAAQSVEAHHVSMVLTQEAIPEEGRR